MVQERKDLISKSKRCYSCLASGHKSRNCTNTRECNINDCTSKLHSRYLHDTSLSKTPSLEKSHSETSPTRAEDPKQINGTTEIPSTTRKHTTYGTKVKISLVVLPALIENEHGHKKLKANVMLNSCSTASYVTERAAHELDLHGPAQNLIISGTGGVEMKKCSRQVTLTVSSLDNGFKGSLLASELDDIVGNTPAMVRSEDKMVTFAAHTL